jgi:DegV family protein with EDD domain
MLRILVDTGADYRKEELQEREMEFVPLQVLIGEKNYKDGIDLEREEFYKILTAGEVFPKTSQPSTMDFLEIFEDVKNKGDEMICILISSELSGTYQTAVMAKNMLEYEGIYLIDSNTATCAIRQLADYACDLRALKKSASEIVEAVENLKSRLRIFFLVDTLEYLYRGGRLSKTAATIGRLANIKPVLSLGRDGKVNIQEKCLGLSRAYKAIINHVKAERPDRNFPIYSLYSYGTENTEALEKGMNLEGYPVDERLQIGASIGTHIGPEAAAVVYVKEEA